MGAAERMSGWRVGVVALAGVAIVGCGSSVVPLETQSPQGPPSPTALSSVATATASPPRPPTATPHPTSSETPSTHTPPPATSNVWPSPTGTARGFAINEADIAAHLDALAEIAGRNGGIRAAGTPGYDASADYVADQLEALGYQVTRQPVDFTFFDEQEPISVTVGDKTWTGPQWLHAMLYSAGGHVTGVPESVAVRDGQPADGFGCEASDWRGFGRGHIAVVMAGPCFRRDQVLLAQNAGATALVGLYPAWGADQTRRPTLLDPAGIEIPAIVAGQETASALLAAAATETTVEITVEVTVAPSSADNVLAELPGRSDDVVMIGGHLDSVLDGPGINDNGSGVATLLAIASALKSQPTPEATIRFAFWAAEEFGEFGSVHYVDDLSATDRDQIRAYINLDMVASPNPARYVYDSSTAPAGSSELTQHLVDALAAMGTPGWAVDLGGGSDHEPFERAGIPAGGVFSGVAPLTVFEAEAFGGEANVPADPCYHLACDDRQNVDIRAALTLGSAVAAVLEVVAY